MQHKFKLSITSLLLLGFCLVLFYQNCSQQSEELGGGSTCVGPNCPSGGPRPSGGNSNFSDSICRKVSQSPLAYRLDLLIPQNYIVTIALDNAPINLPSIVLQGGEPAFNDPNNVVPGGCPIVVQNPDGTIDCGVNHSQNNGWVRFDCACVSGQGFTSTTAGVINSNWNMNRFAAAFNTDIKVITKANDGIANAQSSPFEIAICKKNET